MRKSKVFDNSCVPSIKFELRSVAQREAFRSIKESDVSLLCGPSGSGKTLLSIWTGICLLNDPLSSIERIAIARLAGDTCGENIGALPGTIQEKLLHLAGGVLDNLCQFMPYKDAVSMIVEGKIEIIPISHLRGRSFNNTFLIVEEIQNLDQNMVLTALTRLGIGSKMVLNGDPNQIDIYGRNGMDVAFRLLNNLDGAVVIQFQSGDIYRHPFVRRLVERAQKLFSNQIINRDC